MRSPSHRGALRPAPRPLGRARAGERCVSRRAGRVTRRAARTLDPGEAACDATSLTKSLSATRSSASDSSPSQAPPDSLCAAVVRRRQKAHRSEGRQRMPLRAQATQGEFVLLQPQGEGLTTLHQRVVRHRQRHHGLRLPVGKLHAHRRRCGAAQRQRQQHCSETRRRSHRSCPTRGCQSQCPPTQRPARARQRERRRTCRACSSKPHLRA